MTKQELIQAVKEIREICRKNERCKTCPISAKDKGGDSWCILEQNEPYEWGIERLEGEGEGNDT
jgi:hypothetical protein